MLVKCWATGDYVESDGHPIVHYHAVGDPKAWRCFRHNPLHHGDFDRTLWQWYGGGIEVRD